ncbi:hypothetical protein E2C01_076410 [Portunus trituberculatus]|uniref:Uncharacterized protein n=1 Tax=Portunus trituberculatus TaxID=210409 RepID=A0A5B7IIG7_PORTR|nr:hypothetical protein [Portunus trituberculatus]
MCPSIEEVKEKIRQTWMRVTGANRRIKPRRFLSLPKHSRRSDTEIPLVSISPSVNKPHTPPSLRQPALYYLSCLPNPAPLNPASPRVKNNKNDKQW